MRQFVPIALVLSLEACSDPAPTPPPAQATAPDGMLAPAPVLALAQQYTDALPWPQDRQAVRRDYLEGFFLGLLHPKAAGRFDPARPQHRAMGYRAGQDYRRTHAAQLDDLMRGYGFTPTVATGEYVCGFETSSLRPREHEPQRWWVDRMGTIDPGEGEPDNRLANLPHAITVRVEGYLSPAGHYGHLGAYDHRLLAKSIVPVTGR